MLEEREMKTEYDPTIIDPEMVTIVENFNKAGIKTLFSCQGHFKESFDGGGQSVPYLLTELPNNPELYSCIFSNKYPNIKVEVESYFELNDSESNALEDYRDLEEYKNLLDSILDKHGNYQLYFSMNWLFYNIDEKLYDSKNEDAYEQIFEFLRKKFLKEMEHLSIDLLKIGGNKQ